MGIINNKKLGKKELRNILYQIYDLGKKGTKKSSLGTKNLNNYQVQPRENTGVIKRKHYTKITE